jgi:hypothetical protein
MKRLQINIERLKLQLVEVKYSQFKYHLLKEEEEEEESKKKGKKKLPVVYRKHRGCHLCRKGMFSKSTNFFQHIFRRHKGEETGVTLPYICDRCNLGLPTIGELDQHQSKCDPTYDQEEKIHNALGAADWAQDLTLQTWDWVLPPNAFTAIPKLADISKVVLRNSLLDFQKDRCSAENTVTVLLSAFPVKLITAMGQEKLENMLHNYLVIKFDKNGMVKVEETQEFPGDGGGTGKGNGIVASRDLPAYSIIACLDAITIPVSHKYQVQV